MSFYKICKTAILGFVVAMISFSCSARVNRNREKSQANAQQNLEPNLVYGDLIVSKESDYLMLPVSIFPDANQGEKSWISKSSRSYKDLKNIYNIIFYSKKDASTNYLLDKKAIIKSFDLIEKKSIGKPIKKFWLYRIIEEDTNKDNRLNYQDATIGYLSDLSGKNLKQITPSNTQLNSWKIVQSTGAIFMEITRDTDDDKKFDTKSYIRVNLDNPDIGKPMVSSELEDKIKSFIVNTSNE